MRSRGCSSLLHHRPKVRQRRKGRFVDVSTFIRIEIASPIAFQLLRDSAVLTRGLLISRRCLARSIKMLKMVRASTTNSGRSTVRSKSFGPLTMTPMILTTVITPTHIRTKYSPVRTRRGEIRHKKAIIAIARVTAPKPIRILLTASAEPRDMPCVVAS
jgi:hypothetical protein